MAEAQTGAEWLDELLRSAPSQLDNAPVTRTEIARLIQALAEQLARLEARIARLELDRRGR
jgi:hypothetical protein